MPCGTVVFPEGGSEKTAIPQLSMLHMEGEAWVQRWLSVHQDHFDPMSMAALEAIEVSSDSWTIETLDWRSGEGGGA